MSGSDLAPFKAKGDRPEWRLIYDALLETADYGDIITYQQLTDALGRDFSENRSPLYKARMHLGETRSRWVEAEPGVGYRVIEAGEHIDAAERRKSRAKKQLRLMCKVQEVTDLSRLSRDQLVRFDTQAKLNTMLYMVAVHHEKRLNRIESILHANGLV